MDSLNSAYTTQPSIGSSETYYKPQLKTEFEANYIQVRASSSRGRKKFTLIWRAMKESEYQSIETFFKNHIGQAFYWTHPLTSVTHTVVFSNDSLESEFVGPSMRTLKLVLEEL